MDINKLREWASKMGYPGARTIPDHFSHVLNPSTWHIWEQVVECIRPKEEVAHAKGNILLQECLNPNHNEQQQAQLQAERKQQLKAKLQATKDKANAKKKQLLKLQVEHDITAVQVNQLLGQIEEAQCKAYMHKKKSAQLTHQLRAVTELQMQTTTKQTLLNTTQVEHLIEASIADPTEDNEAVDELYCANASLVDQVIQDKHTEILKQVEETISEIEGIQEIREQAKERCNQHLIGLQMVHIENEFEAQQLEEKHSRIQEDIRKAIDSLSYCIDIDEQLSHVENQVLLVMYDHEMEEIAAKKPTKHNEQLEFAKIRLESNNISLSCQMKQLIDEHLVEQATWQSKRLHSLAAIDHSTTLYRQLATDTQTLEMRTFALVNLSANRFNRRDYAASGVPCLSADNLYKLVSSIEVPVSNSKALIEYFISKRMRYEKLLAATNEQFLGMSGVSCHNLKALQDTAAFNNRVVNDLQLLVCAMTRRNQHALQQYRMHRDLWLQAGWSRSLLANHSSYKQHDYEYYEQLYAEYFSQLE